MDLLDRLLRHDAWTTRTLLLQSAALADADLDRTFAIDHLSLRGTFAHMIRNMEVWTDLIRGVLVRPDAAPTLARAPVSGLIERLDAVAPQFARSARRLSEEGRLDELWLDELDNPPTRKSYGGTIGHVLTHDMHHRAHLLLILRWLNVPDVPEGDLLGWEAQTRSASTTRVTDTREAGE